MTGHVWSLKKNGPQRLMMHHVQAVSWKSEDGIRSPGLELQVLVSSCVAAGDWTQVLRKSRVLVFVIFLRKKNFFFVFHAALVLRGKKHITLVFAAPDSCGSPPCHTFVKKNLGFVTIPRLWRWHFGFESSHEDGIHSQHLFHSTHFILK